MALVFPSNPNVNDTYTVNGRTYVWNGTTWRTIKAPVPDVLPTLSVDNNFSAGGVLHVDSENNEIGIGTAAPSHQLHLTQDLGVDGNLIVGGTITVPTPTAGTNDTTAATTAFVQSAISSKQDSSTALTTSTSFGGDVSGTYDAIVISDDSHNHVISNVDGLQTALDAKQNSSTALTTSTAFSGDVSGTYNAMVVADDSHNHIIDNVDGLQTALDAKLPSSSYTAADVLTKIKTVDGAGSGLDADTLDGVQGDNYATKTYVDTAVSNLVDAAPTTLDTLNELAAALGDDPNFATTVAASIGTKLDSSAYTASDVLTKIKTVDGTGSGLDADTLDGVQGANFLRSDTSDSMTGTLTATAFSGPLTGNVTGNADTATKLATARTISLTGDVTGSASFDGSANASITATVADDSHNHIISNVDGLQTALDGKAASSHTHSYLPLSGGTVTGLLTASGGIDGLTLANGISGSNFNITGVNQIEIADPGEGIVWKGGASGDISLIVVDDASDNILRTSAAQFQVGTSTVWHTGNDGSGSGLDADLLDGNHASAFVLKNTSYEWTSGQLTFRSADVLESTSGDQATLEVYQDTAGADAFMQFHVAGDYAAYFGLKGDINDFAVGGWSMGGAYYKVWHQGNDGSGSGLDADLLDGNHASAFASSSHTHSYISTSSTNTSNLYIRNTSPTIYLRDTDHRSAMIHVNSNIFYVLRGSGNDSTSWASTGSGWPLQINLSNNTATFGGRVESNAGGVYIGGSAALEFNSTNGARVQMYGQTHSMGVQNATTYIRTSNTMAFFRGGSHSNTQYDPGSGGVMTMYLDWYGSIYIRDRAFKPNGGSWENSSDERLKKNIAEYTNGLSLLKQLRPVSYEWDASGMMFPEGTHIGLIAQEVEQVHPEWVGDFRQDVTRDSDGEVITDSKSLSYTSDFNAIVISAIKELAGRIEALEAV